MNVESPDRTGNGRVGSGIRSGRIRENFGRARDSDRTGKNGFAKSVRKPDSLAEFRTKNFVGKSDTVLTNFVNLAGCEPKSRHRSKAVFNILPYMLFGKKQAVVPNEKKVAMVSGASSGIGKALSLEFLKLGYRVSLAARRDYLIAEFLRENLSESEIESRCLIVKTDVSREEDCKRWVEQTVGKFGRIDILVNNAGISMRGLFSECKLDVLRRLMDVNFWGTTYCSHYAIEYLLQSKGSLVGISSIAGYQSLPGRAAYSASKAAIQGLLKTIRIENRKKGLHVLIACPGFTASNIRAVALDKDGNPQGETPRDEGKMMTAEKVARLIIKGIAHRKRSLILTPLGKITVWVGKFWPQLTEGVAYSYMAKEPNSPFK